MGQSITDFIAGFNGGTRPNRFKVTGTIGPSTSSNNSGNATSPGSKTVAGGQAAVSSGFTEFHVRTASLPEAVLGAIGVNWRGRTVAYPGDREYKPWQITVLDDTNSTVTASGSNSAGKNNTSTGGVQIYKAFHDWHNNINNHETNIGNNVGKNAFAADWTVEQLATNSATTIKKFTLKNCWPIAIGALELDAGQDNKLSAFAVTMVYTHYKVDTIT